MLKRYLIVVGIILAVLVAAGAWLKPPLDAMRKGVDEGLSAYAAHQLKAGEVRPEVSHVESHDWVVAVSHVAKVGDKTFYCFGAFKVTFCQYPDE